MKKEFLFGMEERLNHYSNKGGHLQRGQVDKIKKAAEKNGIPVYKGDISFCARRFTRRIPNDGKR